MQRVLGASGGIAILVQLVLYFPVSNDLKALLLENHYYMALLIAYGILFIFGYVLVAVGGNKKSHGCLWVRAGQLEFNLRKKTFTLRYDEIESIQYYLTRDEQWQWNFVTTSEKFSIKFHHIAERYRADTVLRGFLGTAYDKMVSKKYSAA